MTQSTPVLEVRHLSKTYPSFKLDDVSFSLAPGRICGFIGRNGAGKSTTLKCLEGSVHPDSGDISFFGIPFQGNEDKVKLRVGYELGGVDYYELKRLSAIADVVASFYPKWNRQTFESYCDRFSLDMGKRIADLSQGMRVKFSLALALSREADLLILDEPTSGLDPASREELLTIFQDLVSTSKCSILFSTHIASDLDKCADDILFIRNGRIVAEEPLQVFKYRYALIGGEGAQKYSVPVLGERKTTARVADLVVRSEAEDVLGKQGVDSDGLLDTPTLDDIMAYDPER
jgi:ABC-2 type transport system ATP-binding protein